MKQNMASRRERKRRNVRVWTGLRRFEAGYGTKNRGKLRVVLDGGGYMHRRGGGSEHERVRVVWALQTELGRHFNLRNKILTRSARSAKQLNVGLSIR